MPHAELAAARGEFAMLIRILDLPANPPVHVDAAKDPSGVGRMVDVAFFDVGVELSPGAREHVTIACCIDDCLREQRGSAHLALEQYASRSTVLHQWRAAQA